MELKDVLDDIQEGTTPPAEPLNLPVSEVPPEALNQTDAELELSVDQLSALGHYKTCVIYRKAIEARPVLDKALALEVFTMLPNLADPLTASKLTSAASAHNKSLMTQRIVNYQPSPESMLPLYGQLFDVVCKMQRTCAEVLPVAIAATEAVAAEYERVKNQAVVVFCRKQIDLITTPLEDIVQIDDRLIDYPPYEGVLTTSAYKITSTSLYCETYRKEDAPSIEEFVRMMRGSCERIKAVEQYGEILNQKLATYSDDAFTQVDFQNLTARLHAMARYKRMYVTETSFIEAILSFLKLLK